MKYGTQKIIANTIGISCSYLNDIIRGRTKCPPALAVRLEKTTGIKRAIWVWGSVSDIKNALDERYSDEVIAKSISQDVSGQGGSVNVK